MPPTPPPPAAADDPLAGPARFRPGGVRVLAVGWWVLAAVLAGDLLLNGALQASLPGLALLALSSALVHALFWQPAVHVDDTGVGLVNVWRRVHLPWSTLEGLDTRWSLTVEAAGRRWSSWAAPASGRRYRPVPRREVPWVGRDDAAIAGSRAPGSSAGEAAVLVQTRWERWRTAPAAERGAGTGTVSVAWLPVPVVGSAVSLLLLLGSLLLR